MDEDDAEWMAPDARERIGEIIRAFRIGVPAAEADALIEAPRRFPDAVQVEQSDTPEAAYMDGSCRH